MRFGVGVDGKNACAGENRARTTQDQFSLVVQLMGEISDFDQPVFFFPCFYGNQMRKSVFANVNDFAFVCDDQSDRRHMQDIFAHSKIQLAFQCETREQ